MKKTEFKTHLENGNVEKVRENLEPAFVEEFIDPISKKKPIHLACENGNLEIVKLLIENKCNIESETKNRQRPIHLACENGNLEIVKLLIENKCNIESETYERQRPIHLASWKGNFKIVKLLIENKCNIESETYEGWRPIHFACFYNYLETVKLLIMENCLFNVSDTSGRTPLEIAKSKSHNEIVHLLSELDKVTKQINKSILENDDKNFATLYKSELLTGRSWLKLAWDLKADKIIKCFLNRPIDVTEIFYIKTVINNRPSELTNSELWEEVLLYKTIKYNHGMDFHSICKPNIINRPTKIILCSFLELAAKHGNFIFFKEIMKKTFYDSETWKRGKKIASHKGYDQIYNSILNREALLKYRQKNDISILHTAVCDNDPEMLEYILKEGLVDPNLNHEIFGTAFAFAISLGHQECLSIFERFNIDCNTQNRYLQSPLHEAINSGMNERCQYLLDHVGNIQQPGFMGQTAMHCAVIRGCEALCDQLTEKGADCLRYMEFCQPFITEKKDSPISKDSLQLSQKENSLTLCLKKNKTIYPCFLKSLDRDKANTRDNVEEGISEISLYHIATLDDKTTFKRLLNIDISNPLCFGNGESLLTRLLKERKFDFCRQIIESKTNNKRYINLKNRNNQTPLQVAIEIESIDIILSLLYETENIDNEDSEGHTALMQLFEKISNKNKGKETFKILNVIKAIICKGGNIYHETSKGKKAIDYCYLGSVREEIEKFYNEQIKFTKNVIGKVFEKERIVPEEKKVGSICVEPKNGFGF